jgi:hypothetical protein
LRGKAELEAMSELREKPAGTITPKAPEDAHHPNRNPLWTDLPEIADYQDSEHGILIHSRNKGYRAICPGWRAVETFRQDRAARFWNERPISIPEPLPLPGSSARLADGGSNVDFIGVFGQNVWHASSDGWPKKLNHSDPLLAPDGVAFPLPSNSPTAQRRQEYPWTAGQSLILLRFPENRHLPSPSHHPIIR